ncbi:hypothetical protein ACFLZ9_02165 [Patescibacteria group bacterium]
MGLNRWAKRHAEGEQVLAYYESVTRRYPDGHVEELPEEPVFVSSVKKEKSGETFMGMFEDEHSLHKYTFPDGKVYWERIQAQPWSSGPVFFLALQDKEEKWITESLWSEEEIDRA